MFSFVDITPFTTFSEVLLVSPRRPDQMTLSPNLVFFLESLHTFYDITVVVNVHAHSLYILLP